MASHASTLEWRIPWIEKHKDLQSMGSQRVRYDRETNTFTYNKGEKNWTHKLNEIYI